MIPMQLIFGIGCAIVAAAAVVYFSQTSPQRPHSRAARHDYVDRNDSSYIDSNNPRVRDSQPGDMCYFCHREMTKESMHVMNCAHALCKQCFASYRKWRRDCPFCERIVIRIDLPGEACAICREPMKLDTMDYLPCEHALHKVCLQLYKNNNYKTCPVCLRKLDNIS
ncbi:uncharacterized protein LOC111601370 [Drosophila hydei]|uniref:Uncharacterized protein LOC111601370 n=1 Tax=Drosophila hydei TaxID=7224 RepID=A0A6J2T0F3_DROHY|nr:uncharacterized protein LOC111601370 [Drosophila hydei]